MRSIFLIHLLQHQDIRLASFCGSDASWFTINSGDTDWRKSRVAKDYSEVLLVITQHEETICLHIRVRGTASVVRQHEIKKLH